MEVSSDEIFSHYYNIRLDKNEIDKFRELYYMTQNIVNQITKEVNPNRNNHVSCLCELTHLCEQINEIVKRCSNVNLKQEYNQQNIHNIDKTEERE